MQSKDGLQRVSFGSDGDVVIPLRLRRRFGFGPGTKAVVEAMHDGILIKPNAAALIRKGRGMLKKGNKPFAEEWAEHKVEERGFE
jgi:bifunctional DNA-binding transcriptional regulator/antitoxin component of YhaV-PrlF toxin-antitoxin module